MDFYHTNQRDKSYILSKQFNIWCVHLRQSEEFVSAPTLDNYRSEFVFYIFFYYSTYCLKIENPLFNSSQSLRHLCNLVDQHRLVRKGV